MPRPRHAVLPGRTATSAPAAGPPRRRIVVGDVHGAYRALRQVLERAGFDPAHDELLLLGDLVDGWPESLEVLEYVDALPRMRCALGNHDHWTRLWIDGGAPKRGWLLMGGDTTIDSLLAGQEGVFLFGVGLLAPDAVRGRWQPLFRRMEPFIEVDDCLLVHGGFDPERSLSEQDPHHLMWDRELRERLLADPAATPKGAPLTAYRRVFLGHSAVQGPDGGPVRRREFWLLDQGAGWKGRLTAMDLATDEWWQSDDVRSLYPEVERHWDGASVHED